MRNKIERRLVLGFRFQSFYSPIFLLDLLIKNLLLEHSMTIRQNMPRHHANDVKYIVSSSRHVKRYRASGRHVAARGELEEEDERGHEKELQ